MIVTHNPNYSTRHVALWNYRTVFGLLFAVVAGLAAAFYIIGPIALNPWNIDWLNADPATHYLGWAFLRKTTDWFIPFTWTDGLGYPWGVSISFLDSIPLVAVLLRPFSPLLGEPFQYIGMYAALCFILQAFFGFKIARRIGLPSLLSAALAAVFFMLAPAFLWRLHAHFALASHWIILAALYYYLRDLPKAKVARWFIPFWILLTIAGAINPYIAVMCLLVALAAPARLWLVKLIDIKRALAAAGVSVGVLAVSLLFFGFFVGGGGDSYAGGGYRVYSMNLLSPIDPQTYPGLVLHALPLAIAGQYEGYNYLGLSIIALLVIGLMSRSIKIRGMITADILPLTVVAVISTVLAASATITAGSFTIVDFPLPGVIERVAQMLRASGRLFWPAYYLLIIAALATLRKLRPPHREIILAFCLLIQILDIMPLITSVRLPNHTIVANKLSDPAWSTLGERHRHLGVFPAWQCDVSSTPDGASGFRTFGMLADNQNMTVNSYYAGRFGQRDFDRHCRQALEPIMAGDLDPATAYVFSDAIINELAATGIRTHRCSLVDGFNLCVHDTENPGRVLEEGYKIGSWIDFSTAGRATPFLATGWSVAEVWGRWSDGPTAGVVLPEILMSAGKSQVTGLEIDAYAFVTENFPVQTVNVFANGQQVGRMEFAFSVPDRVIQIPLPADLVRPDQAVRLRFEIESPRSPADVGQSVDGRKLGIAMRKLRFL
jgi:hypothetical protein